MFDEFQTPRNTAPFDPADAIAAEEAALQRACERLERAIADRAPFDVAREIVRTVLHEQWPDFADGREGPNGPLPYLLDLLSHILRVAAVDDRVAKRRAAEARSDDGVDWHGRRAFTKAAEALDRAHWARASLATVADVCEQLVRDLGIEKHDTDDPAMQFAWRVMRALRKLPPALWENTASARAGR